MATAYKRILAFDIGGTGLKAALVDERGRFLSGRLRIATPQPGPPKTLVKLLVEMVRPLKDYDAITIGFPGYVRQGVVRTGPNLGTNDWAGFPLERVLSQKLGKPARLVERSADGGVKALLLDTGERVEGDVFFDCTGFQKRLIVKELNAPWISYAHELPVNRALPFWLPIGEAEEMPNYTRAWAQEAGWMWQIPTQGRFGCGYVYSDEFRTPEEAKLEVERVLGREVEVRGDIRFQIGRIVTPWIRNVIAVGLSSSFLEPLESTSIHGTIVQMMLFAKRFLKRPEAMTDADRADYNARIGRQVDDFRTFVNTHYMTERDDTPFWREVREHRIHPETKERLAHWRQHMPRMTDFPDYLDGLPHVQTQLHYPVLEGLGLLNQDVARAEMAADPKLRQFARETYDSLVKEYAGAAKQALGHAEFLRLVNEMR